MQLTDQHLIHDDPKRPPVTELVVPGLHEHLGSDVVGSAYCGEGLKHGPHIRGARRQEGAQRPVLETKGSSTAYGYPKVTGQDGPVANGRPALPERFHSER